MHQPRGPGMRFASSASTAPRLNIERIAWTLTPRKRAASRVSTYSSLAYRYRLPVPFSRMAHPPAAILSSGARSGQGAARRRCDRPRRTLRPTTGTTEAHSRERLTCENRARRIPRRSVRAAHQVRHQLPREPRGGAVVLGYRVVRDLMPAEEHSHGRAPRDGTVRVRRAVSSTSADLDYIFGRNV